MNNNNKLEIKKKGNGLFWSIHSLWYKKWDKEFKNKDLGINDIIKIFYMNGYKYPEIEIIIENYGNDFIKRLYYRERRSKDIGNLYNEKWVSLKEALEFMKIKREFLDLFWNDWDYPDNLWKDISKVVPGAKKIRKRWLEILDWWKLTNRKSSLKNPSINTMYISDFLQRINLSDVFAIAKGILKIRESQKSDIKKRVVKILDNQNKK